MPITVKHKASSGLKPVEFEARHLLAMVNTIVLKIPQAAQKFSLWREELHLLLHNPDLETIAAEAQLDRLSIQLRQIWMGIAHSYSDPNFKSPLKGATIEFPMGERYRGDYERLISPFNLEKRCDAYRPTPSGWRSRHMLFRSGMATITAFMQNLRPHLFGADHSPVKMDFFGGYFETNRVFDLFSSPLLSFQRHANQRDFLKAVERNESELLFLEPVAYDWDMEALNFDELVAALARRKTPPKMIIIDTTIVGTTFPVKKFLECLPGEPAPIVMQISSGLKLDQEGLEIANVGIMSLFWSKKDKAQKDVASVFARKIRSNRKITGTGLSVDEMSLLAVPWFLNFDYFSTHSSRVFENNALLAETLSPVIEASHGVFSHISHPSLSDTTRFQWSVSPFVIFHLRQELDTEENHARLTEVLLNTSRQKNIAFGTGMSFGFRSHRFEIIKPREILHPNGKVKGVLKIAMGSRQGPMRNAVIDLMKTIAASAEIPSKIKG